MLHLLFYLYTLNFCRYLLERRTVEDVITSNITSPTAWLTLYNSLGTVYDDVGLGVYSLQQYKVRGVYVHLHNLIFSQDVDSECSKCWRLLYGAVVALDRKIVDNA